MILKSGAIKTFEVPLAQFAQMRYNVAKALSDMSRVERHPIIKVVEEVQKREMEEKV
jgi:hypothetical protein